MFPFMYFAENKTHRYYLSSSGTDMRPKYFNSRKEAEMAMNSYCIDHGYFIECTECDKHERKYSNHKGVRFYINRV